MFRTKKINFHQVTINSLVIAHRMLVYYTEDVKRFREKKDETMLLHSRKLVSKYTDKILKIENRLGLI